MDFHKNVEHSSNTNLALSNINKTRNIQNAITI